MISLLGLWLPILLSAVLVFVVSSILHMVIPIHKSDFKKFPEEEKLLESLRSAGVPPGAYMFPCAGSMAEMGTPEMIAKYNQGPVGYMTVFPNGPPAIGKSLVQWFLYSVVIGIFVAYIGLISFGRGAEYMEVFRLTGTVAILAYAVCNAPESIWKGVSWVTTGKFVFEGILYGLVTAGTFGWLWPDAL